MGSNNFNERLHDLQETLRILHKKSLENNGLSGIDQEVIKFKIVQFYEQFLIHEDLSPIRTESSDVIAAEATIGIPSKNIEVQTIAAANIPPEPFLIEKNESSSFETYIPDASESMREEVSMENSSKNIVAPEPVLAFSETLAESIQTEKIIETISSNTVPAKGLNDRFSHIKSNNSVNERFKTSNADHFSDRFHSEGTSVSELLDLNKKMLFVTQIFGGNHELFQQVLKRIDAFTTSDEAIIFMEHNKSKLNLSDKQEEIYLSFLDMIKKKF